MKEIKFLFRAFLRHRGGMTPFAAALSGFLTTAALIVAIGAQNTFVLRQGLQRRHVGPVILFCGSADTLLVSLGVAGAGSLLALVPGLATALTLGGSGFLFAYGLLALRRASGAAALAAEAQPALTLGRTLAATAAFTLLNPHVYLDAVMLMGAAGASLPAAARPYFVLGASAASFGWFAALGYGARALAPILARPATWRVIDGLVGVTMVALAGRLLLGLGGR